MPILIKNGEHLYVGTADVILVCNTTSGDCTKVKLPEIVLPDNLSKGQEELLRKENKQITCMCVSTDGKYVAAATENKQVAVYTKELKVCKNFVLTRSASKLRFKNETLLIADKTGDAYVLDVKSDESPRLILGHLSMLLDILITECGKFIVTCDRDEKIRITHYPNSYNIQNYCLGHREFVTGIEVVGDVLMSASGDGTVRFWDFLSGKQLALLSTNEYVKDKCLIETFKSKMDLEKVEVTALPVTEMQVTCLGDKILLAVTLTPLDFVQIFVAECASCVSVKHVQNIFVNELLAYSLSGDSLYILTATSLSLYKFNDKFELKKDNVLEEMYKNHTDILTAPFVKDDVSVLFKRKFDNVQEYLERKKMRLESK